MPANPSGDDDTPVRGKEPVPAEVDPASPETRAAERGRSPGLRPRAGRPIGMAGPFGGAQHLVDEAFGPRRPGAADAPWPNAKIAIALAHGRAAHQTLRPTVPGTPLYLLENFSISAPEP